VAINAKVIIPNAKDSVGWLSKNAAFLEIRSFPSFSWKSRYLYRRRLSVRITHCEIYVRYRALNSHMTLPS
jgi:hypothetical protein